MKKTIKVLAFLLFVTLLLPSCAASLEAPPEVTLPTTTTNQNKKPSSEEAKEDEKEIMQKEDPKGDNEMNILMIGNSYCYYYTDELCGMAKAAGIDLNIYNLYASGAEVREHWEWHIKSENACELFRTTAGERKKISPASSLNYALRRENWDVISFQEGGRSYRLNGMEGLRGEKVYLEKLFGYVKEQFPQTSFYWHCTWVPQVGFSNEIQNFYMNTKEDEVTYQNAKITLANEIRNEFGLKIVPSGVAWLDARYNPVIDNKLCLRKDNPTDLGHDGDVGGGQYLNACVWFEVLTGKSCIGNTFRPSYELDESKIQVLQQAAHKAVAQYK